MTRTGTIAIGGSAKIAMLMPRASRSLTGTRTKRIAAATATALPMTKPRKAACTVASTCGP